VHRILIAEDEPRISSFLDKGLRAAGFSTRVVDTGTAAAAEAVGDAYDLLLLDLGLPEMDGTEVLRTLRGRGERLPVIALTHRDSVRERVEGLELGADDYITKPFSFEEVVARVRARLREPAQQVETTLQAGGVTLDLLARTANLDGRRVDLTTREFMLAETFMHHPGQVLSREQLLDRVWGYDYDPGSNVVDVAVRCLRRKLGADLIRTVRGAGYCLDA
jgi:DNA-binding response OmpR family regulator